MKPPPFEYHRPADAEEALALLAEHGDDAKVLAGGQSLVPLLNLRITYPQVLVDIGRVAVFGEARKQSGGATLGATVTHAQVEDGAVPDPTGGLLRRVATGIGYRAIRNRGTLGGSLVHADPAAEWPVTMLALGAVLRVRSAQRERTLAVRDLYKGHFLTALEPDEIVVSVDIPAPPAGTRWGYCKLARKLGEFADSIAVALVATDDAGRVTQMRLCLGAAAEVPLAIDGTAAGIVGRRWDDQARQALSAHVIDTLGDVDADHARHLHAVSARRAVDDALGVAA